MRKIAKVQRKVGNVYHYQLDDGSTTTALQSYEKGESVRSWFDAQYNMIKIGKLCQKCRKPIKNDSELVEHEFCQLRRG